MKNIDEINKTCADLKIETKILQKEESKRVINEVLSKYKVVKPTGHLSIYNDSVSIPLEKFEFSYSKFLNDEPVFMFFDQGNLNKEEVISIENGKKIGEIMENSFGMEYFVTNHDFSYLLAVNWYVIEGAGDAKEWISKLQ